MSEKQVCEVQKGQPVTPKKQHTGAKNKRKNKPKKKCKDKPDEYYMEPTVRASIAKVHAEIETWYSAHTNEGKEALPVRVKGYSCAMELLFDAIIVGHINVVRLLVNNDKRRGLKSYCSHESRVLTFGQTTGDESTAVELAARLGHFDIVDYLVQQCGDGIIGDCPMCPLASAASRGFLPIVKYLVQHGAVVNRIQDNNSPLVFAVMYEKWATAEYLISVGANIHFSAMKVNVTPLYLAAKKNGPRIAKMLLDGGAEINTKSGIKEFTPVFIASRGGHYDVVKLLVDRNADVNLRTTDHDTPLLAALKNGHKAVAKLLMGVPNINLDCQQYNGHSEEYESPLLLAMKCKYYDIIDLLLKKGVDLSYTINPHEDFTIDMDLFMYNLCYLQDITITRKLIGLIDINEWHSCGSNYLLVLCRSGPLNRHTLQTVKECLKHGIQINLRDADNKTPLYYVQERRYTPNDILRHDNSADAVAELLKTHNIVSTNHASFNVAFAQHLRTNMPIAGLAVSKHIVRDIARFLQVPVGVL